MLINGKTGNRNGQQNRKTEVFQCKNQKSHGPPLLSKHNKTRYLQNTTQNSPPLFLGLVTSIVRPSKYWTIMIKQGDDYGN